jgi:hypothetical protein
LDSLVRIDTYQWVARDFPRKVFRQPCLGARSRNGSCGRGHSEGWGCSWGKFTSVSDCQQSVVVRPWSPPTALLILTLAVRLFFKSSATNRLRSGAACCSLVYKTEMQAWSRRPTLSLSVNGLGGHDLQTYCFYGAREIYRGPAREVERTSVKTLRLSATLAALILTASTACAAVINLSTALGPSGHYTTQAYYQGMLGGQPMTGAQQAYANQEDQLRQLGFLSELGGDFALGQMFYHMAYGITSPPPPSALDSANGGSGLGSSSTAPSGLGAGSSGASDAGSSYGSDAGSSYGSESVSAVLTTFHVDPGIAFLVAVPEASTWAMMLLGFAGLSYAGWRGSRKPALHSA